MFKDARTPARKQTEEHLNTYRTIYIYIYIYIYIFFLGIKNVQSQTLLLLYNYYFFYYLLLLYLFIIIILLLLFVITLLLYYYNRQNKVATFQIEKIIDYATSCRFQELFSIEST